jgi:hypothetical protein
MRNEWYTGLSRHPETVFGNIYRVQLRILDSSRSGSIDMVGVAVI